MQKTGVEDLYQIYCQHPLIVTDSRKVEPGCLFFALRGEKFNANLFASDVIGKGAAFAVVDDESAGENEQFIYVDDCLESLQQLALRHRKCLKIPVIGITGSNGKTTTKELISRVLAEKYKVFATPGNLNNHIGLPLSLLMIDKSHEIAVLEFGANHRGENEFLCRIALPDFGITTNIGKDHLGEFGGFEGVVEAYKEFTDYFNANPGFCFFLNHDDEILKNLLNTPSIISYGTKAGESDCIGRILKQELKLEAEVISSIEDYVGTSLVIKSNLFGAFNLPNILAAVCFGQYFKVPADGIKTAIETFVPENNRSQIIRQDSNIFIFDAYNANPSSMQPAVESFAGLEAANKILILGEMYELGDESEQEHFDLATLISTFNFNEIILVGPAFKEPSVKLKCNYFDDYNGLKQWFGSSTFSNTTFFIKGSRGVSLEKAFEFYKNQ